MITAMLLDAIAEDVEAFIATRRLPNAERLSERTGHQLDAHRYPQYFFGRMDSPLVLVHQNPGAPPPGSPLHSGDVVWKSVDAYLQYFSRFGRRNYGPQVLNRRRQVHDRKQVQFLRPFGVLPLREDSAGPVDFQDLENVIDQKLQLELIPYSSQSLDHQRFSADLLRPHLDRVLDSILAYPRRYVLFCGKIFDKLLADSVVHPSHEFHLHLKSGLRKDKVKSRFSMLRIQFRGLTIPAGLAHSFARQGIRCDEYGQRCHEIYTRIAQTL
jgi:hypothetical protein